MVCQFFASSSLATFILSVRIHRAQVVCQMALSGINQLWCQSITASNEPSVSVSMVWIHNLYYNILWTGQHCNHLAVPHSGWYRKQPMLPGILLYYELATSHYWLWMIDIIFHQHRIIAGANCDHINFYLVQELNLGPETCHISVKRYYTAP